MNISALELKEKYFYPKKAKWTGRLRSLTYKLIDAAFITKSPAGLQGSAVILHGASCSGKSTIIRQLNRRYAGCTYVEMDDYYGIEAGPDILNDVLNWLAAADVDTDRSRALVSSIEQSHGVSQKRSRHTAMVELLKACLSHDAVVTTCGNLPPPHIDNGYYQLLGQCTNKTVLHVLVAPDNAVHIKRIRARGRETLTKRFLNSNARWLRKREFYDLVLAGSESTAKMLESIQTSVLRKKEITDCDRALAKPTLL